MTIAYSTPQGLLGKCIHVYVELLFSREKVSWYIFVLVPGDVDKIY